ncbi:hypothetical protein IMSHALPRED_008273 [Imshaugia aleurites]|uniref:Uncharacterized protein n=1 Tax=Imshaugia aleurites TaxID=172621 RepID=A0A8H3FU57_9LECA|nr:hypothetical protein IMSHALPRED_008273 [Imshaugia aleurites]
MQTSTDILILYETEYLKAASSTASASVPANVTAAFCAIASASNVAVQETGIDTSIHQQGMLLHLDLNSSSANQSVILVVMVGNLKHDIKKLRLL